MAWRCWPLELVNGRGTHWATLSQEIPVLAQLEPDHFSPPRRETWPSTLLPAMEALKVAGELGGSIHWSRRQGGGTEVTVRARLDDQPGP